MSENQPTLSERIDRAFEETERLQALLMDAKEELEREPREPLEGSKNPA